MKKHSLYLLLILSVFYSCSPVSKIGKIAKQQIFNDSSLQNALIGIALYDPVKQQYLYSQNADKYFVPASNVKIFSCYAGLKFLGDQLPGILFSENDSALFLIPTGDPTFLHSAFKEQPIASFIRETTKNIYVNTSNWKTTKFGPGWSWDDYNEEYMAERSPMPVYGNTVKWYQIKTKKEEPQTISDTIDIFIYSEPEIDGIVNFGKPSADGQFRVIRDIDSNNFTLFEGKEKNALVETPFVTNGITTTLQLIEDSLHKQLIHQEISLPASITGNLLPLYSRPVDSMLKWMMHQSDNLFAEQTIVMSSLKELGEYNTDLLIEKLLKNDFAEIPNKPRWVDGSGLSRYNLFSPKDMIWMLEKMDKEFSWERISGIFPTGGQGTLGKLYASDSTRIYAKTGTLSGVSALSGYIITNKKRKLIFSLIVNNHTTTSAIIRKKFSEFLHNCMKYY